MSTNTKSTNTTERTMAAAHLRTMATIEAMKSTLAEIDSKIQSCASLISEAKQALSPTYKSYGPDRLGEFGPVPATDLQTGDVLPSHDGLYHVVDAVYVGTDVVYATIRRGYRGGEGPSYCAEWQTDATVLVLL